MLDQLEPILETWAQPVRAALFAQDATAARAAYSEAQAQWERGASDGAVWDESTCEALQVSLRLLRFEVDEHFAGAGGPASPPQSMVILAALDELETFSPATPAGALMLVRALFEVRCCADRRGVRDLLVDEAEGLLAQLPDSERDEGCWSLLAFWAFRHNLAAQLFTAYSHYLTKGQGTLSRYAWERLRLMYLLTAGEATLRDVEQTIDRLPHAGHAELFAEYIEPRCIAAGCWNLDLQVQLDLKRRDLEHPGFAAARGRPQGV